jgi:excinuclease UvrABC ATPase subunit
MAGQRNNSHRTQPRRETCDWIIDLGPEGGDAGGHLIAKGTPEQVAKDGGSVTGKYLKPYLKGCNEHT